MLFFNEFNHERYLQPVLPDNHGIPHVDCGLSGPQVGNFSQNETLPCQLYSPILAEYHMEDVIIYHDILIILGYTLLLQILFALCIYFKHTGRRSASILTKCF